MSNTVKIIAFMLGFNFLFQIFVSAQEQKIVTVKDEGGNPVSGATVIFGERSTEVTTNENGEFLIPFIPNLSVYINAEGFESRFFHLSTDDKAVILIKTSYHSGKKNTVNVPFGKLTRRQIPGSVGIINPEDILSYDEQSGVGGLIRGRVSGLFSSYNIRGSGNPLFVINGIPTQDIGNITSHEIQEITVLKDLSTAMLYGSRAEKGVILINTKRGSPYKKDLSFTLESGFNNPISYPEYLSAADYMELYNEASLNDELEPRYSQEKINETRTGNNPLLYPDENYYNSNYLKDMSTFQNFNANLVRGNETGQFFVNVGWRHNNGLFKKGKNENNDRFVLRTAIDYKVTDIINLKFNSSTIIKNYIGPRYTGDDFWKLTSTYRPNLYPLLLPLSELEDRFPEIVESANIIENKYILGGTQEYQTNLYGDLFLNGSKKTFEWLMDINTSLEFDLSGITKGLKGIGLFSFMNYNFNQEEMLNTYAVYSPSFASGTNTINKLTKIGNDVKVHDQTVTDGTYYKGLGVHGILDYHRKFNGIHELNAIALSFLDMNDYEGVYQTAKYGHLGFRANYMYSDKYVAEISGVYAGSGKYIKTNNKYAFSPGIGLGWIISEESFLNNNPIINYLKLIANWSILNSDENLTDYNVARDYYTQGSSYYYLDQGQRNYARNMFPGNPNLQWEKILNFNLGFESMLFDYKLGVDASYFYDKNYDLIVKRQYTLPGFFGVLPYDNYGSEQYQGFELGLTHAATLGDLKLNFQGNFVYSFPKILSIDEPFYVDEYRRTEGRPSDGIYAYVAMGLFKDQADIDNHAIQSFGTVKPGDIKYKDLNNDGVIDENDQMMIGNSRARVNVGFNMKLKYKAFEIFALSTGQFGSDKMYKDAYYWVYGERKYSAIVWDRWTPETADIAKYPRLSTISSSNNFRNSTFWLYRNNWFTIHTVQFNYTWSKINFAGLNEMRFFLKANNLFTFSENREKIDLNIGSTPKMRVFSFGVNIKF